MQARASLAKALAAKPPGLANFVLRGSSVEDAEVTGFSLTREVAETVRTDIWSAVEKLIDKQMLPYDPSYQTSTSQVLVERLDDIPYLQHVDAEIRMGDVEPDRTQNDVVAMAHAVGTGDRQVIAYRMKGPGIATRRAKGLLQLVPRDGIYAPIDDEVLYYEPRFDLITHGEWAYFTSTALIQTKLNAPEKAQELARQAFQVATRKVDIEGRDLLEKAVVEDPTLRAKMAYVARLIESDPAYAENLTTENLVKFVKANPDFDIPIARIGRKVVLAFDASPQRRHQIPRLLADDYLFSQLTKRKYEAGSKQRVSGSPRTGT